MTRILVEIVANGYVVVKRTDVIADYRCVAKTIGEVAGIVTDMLSENVPRASAFGAQAGVGSTIGGCGPQEHLNRTR